VQGISPRSTKTRSYQFSLRTAKQPDEVLRDFAERPLPGIALAERGHNYLILKPRRRHRYSGEVAALLGVAIVLGVLILTAVSPVIIALLPLALLPGLPVVLDHRPDLAISAVPDEGGGTRVTVHGLASRELAAALDAYLGGLPRHVPQAPMHGRLRTGPPVSRGAGSPP
jgi:hypothetical protein